MNYRNRLSSRAIRNIAPRLGGWLLIVWVAILACGPGLHPVGPFDMVAPPLLEPFTQTALPLGSDHLGRDVLAGLLHGGRTSLAVALGAAALALGLGIVLGTLAGYFGGGIDLWLSRVIAFGLIQPPLLLAMALIALLGASTIVVTLAIAASSWAHTARVARIEARRLSASGFVLAARALGFGPVRVLTHEILPNAAPTLRAQAALTAAAALLLEAGLSFLGLTDPQTLSWGLMIGDARHLLRDAWWPVVCPALGIVLSVLAIGLIGNGDPADQAQ